MTLCNDLNTNGKASQNSKRKGFTQVMGKVGLKATVFLHIHTHTHTLLILIL